MPTTSTLWPSWMASPARSRGLVVVVMPTVPRRRLPLAVAVTVSPCASPLGAARPSPPSRVPSRAGSRMFRQLLQLLQQLDHPAPMVDPSLPSYRLQLSRRLIQMPVGWWRIQLLLQQRPVQQRHLPPLRMQSLCHLLCLDRPRTRLPCPHRRLVPRLRLLRYPLQAQTSTFRHHLPDPRPLCRLGSPHRPLRHRVPKLLQEALPHQVLQALQVL
mmetsp:Transcript_18448/g.52915  ORF Transcript_18448/g.52915 Transcript_18448/m.52915 type:complete len:215 (+) Transcript_18448:168-812(+)